MGTVTTIFPSASVVVLERCGNTGEKTTKNKNKSLKTSLSCSKFCCICGADVSHKTDPTMTPAQFDTFIRHILVPSKFPSFQFAKSRQQCKWICTICLDSFEQVEFLTTEMTKLEKALKMVVDLLELKMAKHSSAKEPVEVVDVDNQVGPIIFSGNPLLIEDEIKEEEDDLDRDAEDVKPIIVEESDGSVDDSEQPDSPLKPQDAIEQIDLKDQPRNIPSSLEEPIPPPSTQGLIADVEERHTASESIPIDDMGLDNHSELDNNQQLINTTPQVHEESSSSSQLIRSTRKSKLRAQQMIRSVNKKENEDNISSSDNEDDDNYTTSVSNDNSIKGGKSSSENNSSESDNDSDKNETEKGVDRIPGSINQHRRKVHKTNVQRYPNPRIGPRFHCSICGKGSLTRALLKKHCRIIHKITETTTGPFNCDICQREFNTLQGLNLHKTKLHDVPPVTLPRPKLPCDICKVYLSKTALYQHKLRMHDKVYPFSCPKCDWKFINSTQLKLHIAKHHGTGPAPIIRARKEIHICKACKIGYNFKKSLLAHIKRVHNADKTLKCDRPRCKKTFYSQARLDEHYEHFHPKEEGVDPKVCKICGETFSNIRAKIDHIGRTHKKADEEKMSCSYCKGMEFKCKNSFKNHMKIHEARKERPYLCSNCGRGFTLEAAYGTHMKIVCNPDEEAKERNRRRRTELQVKYRARVKNKSIKCKFCGTGFLGQRKLDFHIARFHKDKEEQEDGR